MTTIDHAARIIDAWTQDGHELNSHVGDPSDLARALAAAGLLAPDLPPVIVDDFDERPHVTITGTHVQDKALLRVNKHGAFHAVNAWSDPMNPAEARERAYALLALANHVEGNTDAVD